MIWTIALVSTGVGGLWLVARHWYGWVVYLANEVLWLAYALATGDRPLAIMACVWFALGVRNLSISWKEHRGTHREGAPSAR